VQSRLIVPQETCVIPSDPTVSDVWLAIRKLAGVRGDDIANEVINHFWMGHAPETMPVTYARLDWKLGLRFAEAQSMGVGFILPPVPIAPSCSKIPEESEVELVLQL